MRRPRTAATSPTTRDGGPVSMIIDVDTGIDDSLAIAYAVGEPMIDLVAATCAAGNVELDHVVANTLGLLDLLGATEVEVAAGATGPIARTLQTTPDTHGPTGTGYASIKTDRSPSVRSAARLIVEEARQRPGELTLVTLGPLTNLAAAVLMEPDLPLLLRDLFIMGGTFSNGGNVTPRVEWNIHVDPEAAKVVLHQWAEGCARGATPLTMMGLDVTETSIIEAGDLLEVAVASGLAPETSTGRDDREVMATVMGHPLLDTLRDALRFYFEFHELHDGFYGAHVHDPFVVGAALDPTLIETTSTVVDVELGGRWTDGETIADWRGHFAKTANVHVARSGDGPAFIGRLRSVLTGLTTTNLATTDRPEAT